MKRGRIGTYETTWVGGETVRAFVPHPLPPNPPLRMDGTLQQALELATVAIGRLDSISSLLPDPDVFLYAYVRREAVLSGQIEGTRSTLSDLLEFEMERAPGVPVDDVTEVSNYVAAMAHGLARMAEGFPLSNRLIREMHERLLASGRGSRERPGEFRASQNWIGGTRPGNALFVPPPSHAVQDCMGALERFLHARDDGLPVLVRAGIAHLQFETIHPFLDGNGRIGRLLIPLLLSERGLLSRPLLYISLHLRQHRDEYFALLDRVRMDGDWEAWLGFYLEAVRSTAENAVQTAQELTGLFTGHRQMIVERAGRRAGSVLRVYDALRARPIQSAQTAREAVALSFPTVSAALRMLVEWGIAREITGGASNRVYVYDQYVAMLSEGAEPDQAGRN